MTQPGPDQHQSPTITAPGFDISSYDRRQYLTSEEKALMDVVATNPRSTKWRGADKETVEPLFRPVYEVFDFARCNHPVSRQRARWRMLLDMQRRGRPYWAWSQEEWLETIDLSEKQYRSYIGAAAYLLGCLEGVRIANHERLRDTVLAPKVFGEEPVARALARVEEVAGGWGYDLESETIWFLRRAVCRALLVAHSPHLEDITEAHLRALLLPDNHERSGIIWRLSRILTSLGILEHSVKKERKSPYRVEEHPDVPKEWLYWCQRWLEHSTLRGRGPRGIYLNLLKVGRWLAVAHPEVDNPEQWTTELAAEYVAVVDGMRVGDWTSERTKCNHPEIGKPVTANTKAGNIRSLRKFFSDCQEWGWMAVRFNPDRSLRVPRSIANLLGPDPKPIDTSFWAKLVRAAMDLEEGDLPGNQSYPIELVRAAAALWVCSGLRSDEISRLRVGCIRHQRRDTKVGETGEMLEKDTVCFLDVPAHKTGKAFTKPVPPIVGERIEQWEHIRPKDQHPMLDETTNEVVHFLFAYRNRRVKHTYLNDALIPTLCNKAGVPQHDAQGSISSHRARATIASQLNNGPEPLSLTELQAFLGHSNPKSTQYYTKVDPTRLAKRYADSGYLEENLATVEVLLDVEALTEGEGRDALYYDLGHGLCANPYWAQCPYRMACVKCPMYVPGEEAQYVRAREGIRRMLETVPMTDEEKRAAEGDEKALNELLAKNDKVPMPGNRQWQNQQIVSLGKKPGTENPEDGEGR